MEFSDTYAVLVCCLFVMSIQGNNIDIDISFTK